MGLMMAQWQAQALPHPPPLTVPELLVLAAVLDEAELLAELVAEADESDELVVALSVAGLPDGLPEDAAPELPPRKSVTYQPEPLS